MPTNNQEPAMQHFAQIASAKLAEALATFNAVAAASAYKSLARMASPEIAAEALIHCSIESALSTSPEDKTASENLYTYNDVERICRVGWTRQAQAFGFAFDLGAVVGQNADGILADAPFAINDRIAGISRLPRRLGDQELLDFARALCAIGAAMHCAHERKMNLDFDRLAQGLSEWLVAKNGKIELSSWTSNQYSWSGAEHIVSFWNDPGPRQRAAANKPNNGPWLLSPALASALEARALRASTQEPQATNPKPKGL